MSESIGRKCENCGFDSWTAIDNDDEYIEVCSNCGEQVAYAKKFFTMAYVCPKCKCHSGTLQDSRSAISIFCNSCGDRLIVKRKLIDTTDERHDVESKEEIPDYKICCPKCNSTQITTGKRGFSLITGFIGSNKTVNRCARCGHLWKPQL